MVFAGRKSRYTGKGESIGNQIDLCREYIRTHYGDAAAQQAVVFEDEGFSGGNLNRPDFKKMMTAAKARKIRAIVVYRLDRSSISDFSSLIEELGRLDIDFVSIRESFDTSSPMGRAMMYIASVFSQPEREIIAERIRDNMHELAKTGRSFTRFSIKSILQNPVYLVADKDAYPYFVDNEAELFATESGKRASPPS